jgi:hypothetical protein
MLAQLGGRVPRVAWLETTGPAAFGVSQLTHERFDRLLGITDPTQRKRDDRLPMALFRRGRALARRERRVRTGRLEP